MRSSPTQNSWRKWLRLSRPRFWIYVFGPFLVGLAAGAPRLTAFQNGFLLCWGLYFLFPANLLIYGVNDIFDWETDRANAKKTEYETLVPPDERKSLWRAIALFNLPFVVLLPFTPRAALPALAAFFFFSVFYSTPPIRAKTKPIVDSIFNTLYICPGAFAYLLIGGQNFSFLLFAAATAWAMAMHAYSAIPDISADRDSSLTTVATLLNVRGTIIFCAACYTVAALISSVVLGTIALVLGAVYLLLMALSWRAGTEESVFVIYRWFPPINTIAGFLLFWSVMFRQHGPELLTQWRLR